MAILVFIEQRDGRVRSVAREALGEASRLAATLGGPVVGVCAPRPIRPGRAEHGLGSSARDARVVQHYEPAGYARAVARRSRRSSRRRCCSPRPPSAATWPARRGPSRGGLAADCTALAVEGGRLIASRPVFAGKAVQRVAFPSTPALVSLRPKVFAPAPRRTAAPRR
jgi:electron transfer flavoprotein alpha subunit